MAECHDCRCHFNPPCSACERCVHIDHPECPEDCQTCEYDHERTGPYRLLDGTWSDEVSREYRLCLGMFADANPNRVAVDIDVTFNVWIGRNQIECFDTFAEAIAYADAQARTKQGENNV